MPFSQDQQRLASVPQSAWPATILSATYTSWGFNAMRSVLHSRIANCDAFRRDLGGIPIRNFYFDGTQSDLDRDLRVYMELARSYQKKRG